MKKCKNPQETGEYEIGYKKPPQTEASKKTRFGGERGNPQGHGFWDINATPRAKLERMITLSRLKLDEIRNNEEAPEFERGMADIIIQIRYDEDGDGTKRPAVQRFQAMEKMINQVYGSPAQTQVTVDAGAMEEKEKSGFIKGVFIPSASGDDGAGANKRG